MKKLLAISISLALFAACGSDEPAEDNAPDTNATENQVPESYDGPTYHSDIKPLMEAHCVDCHIPDDIAPFALQTYDEVKATAAASHLAMVQGTMPPWPPNDECADYKNRRGISQEDIALFEAWIDAGHVEGEPQEASDEASLSDDVAFQGTPDRTLDWGFDYHTEPPGEDGIDDYRCFTVDPDIDEDKFVNMVHTRPDNAEIVHHMIAYVAPEGSDDRLETLESEDERPGYECFGGPRVSDATWLAAWAPGEVPTPFEEGHGIRLEENDTIVIQMHYNIVNDPEGTDRTELDLYFLDDEEYPDPTELAMVPLPDGNLHLEAGDPEAEAYTEGPEVPIPLTVHGVFPHMHLLGTEIDVHADTGDGEVCLIDIPNWDFDWQGIYMFQEPIELAPPSTVKMRCQYDNSASNQPAGRTPQDVVWGDGTYDEMCLAIFVIEIPPGLEDIDL